MCKVFSILILLTLITSCNGQKKAVVTQITKNEEKMVLVDQNDFSGADTTETMVIKSAKALKLFYSRINRTRKPGLPVPEIDFSKNIVVILCSSNENFVDEKGLSVLDENDSEIVIGMEKKTNDQSDSSSSNTKNRISPFFVYKMPLTDKKVSFEPME